MHRCSECNTPIPEARIVAYLDAYGKLPEKCVKCVKAAGEQLTIGYMAMNGQHGSRKVGAELVVLDPMQPTRYGFKELVRQAKRVMNRSR